MEMMFLNNYLDFTMKLIKANVSKNLNRIDEVIEDLSNIRWGFQKAIEIQTGIITVDEVMKEQAERNQTTPPEV